MKKQYLNMYKWDNLPDSNIEKFNGRLDALPFEISLNNKLGCADILISIYLPYDMYNSNMEKQYLKAKKDYELRSEKLTLLIELIKNKVDCNKMIDNEYLYELWISRLFDLNWQDNPLKDIEILYKELSLNNCINPYNIDLSINLEDKKTKSGKFKEIVKKWKSFKNY